MERKGFATRNKSAEDFINEAGTVTKEEESPEINKTIELSDSSTKRPYPWESSELSARVQKQYNLRLDEITLEKLRWVGKNVTVSTHQWVVDVLQAAIEEKIAELSD